MIAHGLKTREKLNVFLCILQGVYWRLRESKAKFVECFVCEVFLKFEGISLYVTVPHIFRKVWKFRKIPEIPTGISRLQVE